MKSVYDHWKTAEGDYFAGANTPEGFRSSYDTIADENRMERVYIIKGGAGTGKSTLMRKIGSAAEKRGLRCEYYLCGSDPDSLDCVVLEGRIAVLDGTAPHIREMKNPGASSSVIDLSRFWNSAVLEESRDEICFRSAEKAAAYASAYRWINAADQINREGLALAAQIFDTKKAEVFIDRFLRKTDVKEYGEAKFLWSHAITMKGRWKTAVKQTHSMFFVEDYYGTAAVFMNLLCRILRERNLAHTVSRLPLNDTIALIRFGGITVAVQEREEEGRSINMKRFITSDISEGIRGRVRFTGKLTDSCLSAACEALAGAAEHHFALEAIYGPAMDFKALARFGDMVIKEIMSRLS